MLRAHKASSRREGPSGLGFAIAKGIAERHQGQIFVTRELGGGSCFQVLLPLVGEYRNRVLGDRWRGQRSRVFSQKPGFWAIGECKGSGSKVAIAAKKRS